MLRQTVRALAKRTPGYVFWRQNTLIELENAKRNYLMSERPVPIAEVARRMVRVKARFEATTDFHERNLLRGEYKYFTGKLSDVRAARAADMIAFLQCGAFFGFWDASQAERIMSELLLKIAELTANELVCLFVCLPGIRKQQSELYGKTAARLVGAIPGTTTQERLAVLAACDECAPPALLRQLLRALEPEVERLSVAEVVDMMDSVSVAPEGVQREFDNLWDALKRRALDGSEELGCMDVAVLYTTLQAGGDCDQASSLRLVQRFLEQAPAGACARSAAMMFSATAAESLTTSLTFAQRMESRTLFLASDFTPGELLAVFKVYLSCLAAMAGVVGGHTTVATTASEPGSSLPAALHAELQAALQRQAAFRHVLLELHHQLVTLLEGAAAYVSTAQQMELLEVHAMAVADLQAALPAATAETTSTPTRQRDSAATALLQQLPPTRTVMKLLADKLIATVRGAAVEQLVRLLELGHELGPTLLPDAVVAAAVQELVRREWTLSGDAAAELTERLVDLTGLRAEHQRKIHVALVPKIRSFL